MRLQKALELAMILVRPRCIYRVAPIQEIGKKKILGKSIRVDSQLWARSVSLMESPEFILVYAITLGEDIDIRIGSTQKKSLSLGYLLDAAGSEIVERIAASLEGELWKELKLEDYQRTARFSPGYCDWGLDGQKEIFGFLKPEEIGLIHTKAYSILPSKSITAAIVGARHIPHRSPCPLCNEKSCLYRREQM
jgi:hypothetical protein